MTAKPRFADLAAAVAGILLVVGSLLDQFGVNSSYDAWHGPVINELIVTYLLGLVVAAVTVGDSLGLLPARFPWRTWAAGAAFAVLLSAIFGAIGLSSLLHAANAAQDPGLGAGPFLGIAGAVILFVAVCLADVIPGLTAPLPMRSASARPADDTPVAGGPQPDVAFGGPPQPQAPQSGQPGGWSPPSSFIPPEPQPAPASPGPAQPSPQPAAPTPTSSTGATAVAGPPGSTGVAGASPFQAPAPFTPFWAAVPTARPIYRADDPSAVLATLHPGTWYAAVAPHAHGLVVQLPTGETGVLVEVADIFRG